MRYSLLAGLAVGLGLLVLTPTRAEERREEQLVEKVHKAMKDAETFLRRQQKRGNWERDVGSTVYKGGWTALAVLALLSAGVSPNDPAVEKGLEFLRSVKSDKTYVVSLQTMALAQARQGVDRERIGQNVRWLLDARRADGWTYSGGRDSGTPSDNSNTQYALLALHEAIQAGVSVPRSALEDIRKMYLDQQAALGTGGWPYRKNSRATMTMTTAGLCGLIITGLDLEVGKQKLNDRTGVAANCGEYDANPNVRDALRWIGERFPRELTEANAPRELGSPFYALYGIERTGRLTGRRYFGGHDWYEVGCRFLVDTQKADGSWESGGDVFHASGWPVVATSFALLFLSKGRTPVLVSKLAWGAGDGWNRKHSDMRHLTDYASRTLFHKLPLAWQVFDIRRTPARSAAARTRLAAQLLESPIVYFNGHELELGEAVEKILKEYLDNGGFIFAEACCGSKQFDRDFRALVLRLYGKDALQPLKDDHPLRTASGHFVSERDFPLEGVQQGCKTVVVYSPQPVAGYWEANQLKTLRARKAFHLGANVIAYATGLEPPQPRLTTAEVVRDDTRPVIKRGYLRVAQLRHGADWEPAPKAMRNLMAEARKVGLDVVLEKGKVYPSDEAVLDYRFLYMHGRGDFREDGKKLENLRFNLKTGGLLLADACCGSKTFDKAFRRFMEDLWAGEKLKLEPIPLNDDLFSERLNGTAIKTVKCRRERADGQPGPSKLLDVPPALEGIKYKGRWVVIYSRYDLGCALEKHKSTDCLGHDYDSAVRLARAAVLYALKR